MVLQKYIKADGEKKVLDKRRFNWLKCALIVFVL